MTLLSLSLLWTDVLIWALVLASLCFARLVQRTPHLARSWRKVTASHSAMISATVLLAYLLVGLLDSVHLKVKAAPERPVEVLSVLDILATPVRERVEKSYAAPFAATLYVKETRQLADGSVVRDYPALQHLPPPGMQPGTQVAAGLGLGGVLFGTLAGVVLLVRRLRYRIRPAAQLRALWQARRTPVMSVWLTVLALTLLLGVVLRLAPHYHILGTDKVGQDVFYEAVKSIRTGLVIGTLTTLIMLPFAVVLGIAAGYFRGWVDDVIQYVYTVLNAVPGVLLIAAMVLILQTYLDANPEAFATLVERADLRLLALCAILGITSWTGLCRLLRAETLKLREMEYVQAARAFGAGHARILIRHILPNVMHLILISVALDFSGLVLAEAVLSYVGVGVDPATLSWGNMINGARLELAREPAIWWSLLAAFSFMFVLVLAANLFADAVTRAFDPRSQDAS